MQEHIADEDFEKLLQIFEQYVGTSHLKLRKSELCKNIALGAAKLGFKSSQELIDKLIRSNGLDGIDSLIEFFTVGETYFFRHKQCFDIIESEILPHLAKIASNEARSQLNIWCAACSSGEEPYSLAMLFDNSKLLPHGCQVNIYASDINQDFLKRAEAGIYSDWSFRELPENYLLKYLKPHGKKDYELEPRIRKKVHFFSYNLLSPEYPPIPAPKLDIILCRNVLIYFNQKQIRAIFNKFQNLLHDEGWLLTSPAEVSNDPESGLEPTNCSGVYFYRKRRPKPEQPVDKSDNIKYSPAKITSRPVIKNPAVRRHEVTPKQTKPPVSIAPVTPAPVKEVPQTAIMVDHTELLKLAKNRKAEVSPELATNFARCCADAGQRDLALHWSENAVNQDNLNPETHYLHAQILHENGEVDAALRELKNVLFLNPDFIAGYFTNGMIQLKNGNQREAVRNLRNAEKLLAKMNDDQEVTGCEGITARNMRETINKIIQTENKNSHLRH